MPRKMVVAEEVVEVCLIGNLFLGEDFFVLSKLLLLFRNSETFSMDEDLMNEIMAMDM